jgi:hypothetical protein
MRIDGLGQLEITSTSVKWRHTLTILTSAKSVRVMGVTLWLSFSAVSAAPAAICLDDGTRIGG